MSCNPAILVEAKMVLRIQQTKEKNLQQTNKQATGD
jgi:hypothetical protein